MMLTNPLAQEENTCLNQVFPFQVLRSFYVVKNSPKFYRMQSY
jgi:hypothetical protein